MWLRPRKVGAGKFQILLRELGKGEYAFPRAQLRILALYLWTRMYTFGLR
jgi:hypothetical protein